MRRRTLARDLLVLALLVGLLTACGGGGSAAAGGTWDGSTWDGATWQ